MGKDGRPGPDLGQVQRWVGWPLSWGQREGAEPNVSPSHVFLQWQSTQRARDYRWSRPRQWHRASHQWWRWVRENLGPVSLPGASHTDSCLPNLSVGHITPSSFASQYIALQNRGGTQKDLGDMCAPVHHTPTHLSPPFLCPAWPKCKS